MSRYIDAEWLLGVAELSKGVIDVDDVYNAPTIEIIHCRECKWFDSKGHCMRLTAEYGTYEDVRTDDF